MGAGGGRAGPWEGEVVADPEGGRGCKGAQLGGVEGPRGEGLGRERLAGGQWAVEREDFEGAGTDGQSAGLVRG